MAKYSGLRLVENLQEYAQEQADRRSWFSPQFLVQLATLFIVVIGGIIGAYAAAQSHSAVLEANVTAIEQHTSQISSLVQQMSNTVTKVQADRENDRRELDDLKQQIQLQQTYIVKITNDIAKLQATVGARN